MKKRILFVINTLGTGGAEQALLALLKHIDLSRYAVDLYVMLGQGELVRRLPAGVHLLNRHFDPTPVLTASGRRKILLTVAHCLLRRGSGLKNLSYMQKLYRNMKRRHRVQPDKLVWKLIADAAPVPPATYDLAVGYLEGAATYFVSDHVRAGKKAAFVHVDYRRAGYTPFMDHGCYDRIGQIWCVSEEVRTSFLKVYPSCRGKTGVFANYLDVEGIRRKSRQPGGFSDDFQGIRILTVCRLEEQKRLEISIEAMRHLKHLAVRNGKKIRWYVLGEGSRRGFLEHKIREAGLEEDFLLPGVRSNPYPFFRQADIYVHCTGYEGKSIAVQEAEILGKPVVLSDTSGNREQVASGVDGLLVPLEPEAAAQAIWSLILHPDQAAKLGQNAAKRDFSGGDLSLLLP